MKRVILKKNYIKILIISLFIFFAIYQINPVYSQEPGQVDQSPDPLTLYGGNNPGDTYLQGWSPQSDNVEWNFGHTTTVYRLDKSLSLRYNPEGEFYFTSSVPVDITSYSYLTFVGRSAEMGLEFGINFLDANNQPIGNTLRFSDFGGNITNTYWTQYNFPIERFQLPSDQVSGIRILQRSNRWFADIYLDEIYLSSLRGQYINPAVPSNTPTPNLEDGQNLTLESLNVASMNPYLFIIPIAFVILAIFLH